MSNHLDQELQNIFAHIYQSSDDTERHDERQPPRTINVYIDVEAAAVVDQSATIESVLDAQPLPTTTNETDAPLSTEQPLRPHVTEPQRTTRRQRAYPALLLFLLLPLVGMLVWLVATPVLLPLWTSSASVTLVTASQHLTTTNTLLVVTNGNTDLTKNQLAGRTLPALTMSQQKTVPTTGTTHQAAHVAHGMLTFYNAAPYTQTVEAGTLLTGADGTQVLTDQTALIPPAVLPTEGQATVSAHAALAGPHGNIRAGDLYGQCCRLNIFVANGAFYGGQDARTYQSVTPQDITNAVTTMKTNLDSSVQAALQTHVQSSETLVTPLPCTSQVTPDHQAGWEAVQVQVMVSETCTGMTYTTQALTNVYHTKSDARCQATVR